MESEKRKAQIREAQKRYRDKQKLLGRKAQPFLLSKADHDNMNLIKSEVEDIKTKEQAISFALSKLAKELR